VTAPNTNERDTVQLSPLELAARQLFALRQTTDAVLSFVMREVQREKETAALIESLQPTKEPGDDTPRTMAEAADAATNRIVSRERIPGAPEMPRTFGGPKAAAVSTDPGADPPTEATQ
jgi:hypothetical protein